MTKWWLVRAGDNNELIPEWKKKNIVSIGWPKLGNPSNFTSREAFLENAHNVYEEEKPGRRVMWASQVWRFSSEIAVGDRIITYIKDKREYMVGRITGNYEFNPALISDYYPNVIHVEWEEQQISRDDLSEKAKNSLGSISTVFRVDDWGHEFELLLQGNTVIPPTSSDEGETETIIDDFVEKSLTMIQDRVDNLGHWEMQLLVSGLLQAMGYNVDEMKKGPDGGVDILAYKDAFGFEQPIIKVQVKHRKSTSSSPEIQQLLGAHPVNANALFVSTGGFTSPAITVARQHNVKLLDLESLVKIIVGWYDKMPNETRSLLPLQRVYIPE
ncbi:restriction endonuclease [Priestia endophytica]|uniref:Restriction system protein n=1 Tax=Priestia endophytica DSM 13796 TaxID=1121089 RepID=A0A1I5YPR8_9BACI|nr:restriction endonuclease [Priestia endophytica]KYG33624.1 restriction endonuclease [Priestia endophytica]SFQ46122.1 restriction system protein [Priestia endophytica DSM 13796]